MKLLAAVALFYVLSNVRGDALTIKFLRDFWESKPPSLVNIYLCWEKDTFELAAGLYKTNALISVEILNNFNKSQKIRPVSKYTEVTTFIVNIDCDEEITLLKMASKERLFFPPNRWLLLTKNQSRMLQNIGKLDLLLDSDVTIAERLNSNKGGKFALSEIYKPGPKESFILKSVGYWNENQSFSYPVYLPSLKRKNLNGLVIPAVTVIIKSKDTVNKSFNIHDIWKNKKVDITSIYNHALIHMAMDFMNSSAEYILETYVGYHPVNGSYKGLLGRLQKGEADISANAIYLSPERISIIDYISMITPTRFCFIFRQPKLSTFRNIYLLPFSTMVWVSFCGTLFITSFLLFYAVNCENKLKIQDFTNMVKKNKDKKKFLSWSDAIFFTFGASCQQGIFTDIHGLAARLAIIALYIAVILMHTSYSANIVALLQSSASRFQTVADLIDSPIQFGIHDTSYNRDYFLQTSEDPLKYTLYKTKIAPDGKHPAFYSLTEGMEYVHEGLFAFYLDTKLGYKLIKDTFTVNDICDLYEIPYHQSSSGWIVIRKYSGYRELLKVVFRRIHESGLQNREYLYWFTKKPVCEGRQYNFVHVQLMDIWVPLSILGYGMATAVGLFIVEVLINFKFSY